MIRKYSIILLFVLPLFFIAPVKVPYNIESNSLVYPGKEWKLMRDANGEMSAEIINNSHDYSSGKTEYIFDRGDIAGIDFIYHKNTVEKGDTIAKINSDLIEEKIVQLKNQISVEQANLLSSSSGEKKSVIDEYKNRVSLAKNTIAFTKSELKRAEKLLKKDLISQSRYDSIKNEFELAEINYKLAIESLETVSTGEKDEYINLLRSKINSLKEQLDKYIEKREKYVITSPFDGKIKYYRDSTNLIKIKNSDELVVKIPVKVSEINYVSNNSNVTLSIKDMMNIEYEAKILNVSDDIIVMGRDQFFLVNARVQNPDDFIRPGMICSASISTQEIPIYQYVRRKIGL